MLSKVNNTKEILEQIGFHREDTDKYSTVMRLDCGQKSYSAIVNPNGSIEINGTHIEQKALVKLIKKGSFFESV